MSKIGTEKVPELASEKIWQRKSVGTGFVTHRLDGDWCRAP